MGFRTLSSGIRALDLRAMTTNDGASGANDGASGAQGAKVTEISPYFHPPPATSEPYRYHHHQPSPPPAPTVPDPQQQHHYNQGAWYSNSQGYYQPSPPPASYSAQPYPQPHTHFNESQANPIYGPPPPSTYSAQSYPQPHTHFSESQANPIYGPPPLPWQTSYPCHQYSQNLDSGPLPTPASYYAPPPQPYLYLPPQHNLHTTNINGHSLTHQFPHVSQISSPHRLPTNQNHWVSPPQPVHVISSPTLHPPQWSPSYAAHHYVPAQSSDVGEECCQLSISPTTTVAHTSSPSATNSSSPAIATLLEQHEVHLSVADAEEASITSPECKRGEAVPPKGTTHCIAFTDALERLRQPPSLPAAEDGSWENLAKVMPSHSGGSCGLESIPASDAVSLLPVPVVVESLESDAVEKHGSNVDGFVLDEDHPCPVSNIPLQVTLHDELSQDEFAPVSLCHSDKARRVLSEAAKFSFASTAIVDSHGLLSSDGWEDILSTRHLHDQMQVVLLEQQVATFPLDIAGQRVVDAPTDITRALGKTLTLGALIAFDKYGSSDSVGVHAIMIIANGLGENSNNQDESLSLIDKRQRNWVQDTGAGTQFKVGALSYTGISHKFQDVAAMKVSYNEEVPNQPPPCYKCSMLAWNYNDKTIVCVPQVTQLQLVLEDEILPEFFISRYPSATLVSTYNGVVLMIIMHKFLRSMLGYVYKDMLFLAMYSSVSYSPFHVPVRQLFSLLHKAATQFAQPISASAFRESDYCLLSIFVLNSINQLLTLKQGLKLRYGVVNKGNSCSYMSCSLYFIDFISTWLIESGFVAIDYGEPALLPHTSFSVPMRSSEALMLIWLSAHMHFRLVGIGILGYLVLGANVETMRVFSDVQNLYCWQSSPHSQVIGRLAELMPLLLRISTAYASVETNYFQHFQLFSTYVIGVRTSHGAVFVFVCWDQGTHALITYSGVTCGYTISTIDLIYIIDRAATLGMRRFSISGSSLLLAGQKWKADVICSYLLILGALFMSVKNQLNDSDDDYVLGKAGMALEESEQLLFLNVISQVLKISFDENGLVCKWLFGFQFSRMVRLSYSIAATGMEIHFLMLISCYGAVGLALAISLVYELVEKPQCVKTLILKVKLEDKFLLKGEQMI